jgi:hypothetical protein
MGPKENLCQQVKASLCAIYFELLKLPSQCMAAMGERERSTLSTKHTHKMHKSRGLYRLHLLHFSFSRGETNNKCFLSSQFDLVYVGEEVKISHMSLLAFA